MTKFLAAIVIFLSFLGSSYACNIEYNITLETFGARVLVELRSGSPGSSKVVSSKRSNGGSVSFNGICQGPYFLAIGDEDSVTVTQTRYFDEDTIYTSRITMQRGSGNTSKKSRKSL